MNPVPLPWMLIGMAGIAIASATVSGVTAWNIRGDMAEAEITTIKQGYEQAALEAEKKWLALANKHAAEAARRERERKKAVDQLAARARDAVGNSDCAVPGALARVLDDGIVRGEAAARGSGAVEAPAADPKAPDKPVATNADVQLKEWAAWNAALVDWATSCLEHVEFWRKREIDLQANPPKEVAP